MEPLLLIATQLLPDFVRLLAGDRSGSVKDQVVDAIKKATGTDSHTDAQHKIDTDPQVKAQLQKDLAEIALAETEEQNRAKEQAQQADLELYRLEAEEREQLRDAEFQQYLRDLQDRQGARAMQTELAEEHNPLAWVAPIIAIALVAVIFYLLRGMMLAREPVVNKDVFNVALGALVTAFTTVVAYYFGSSVGSQTKDDALKSGHLIPNPKTMGDDGASGGAPSPPARPDGKTPGPVSGGGATPRIPPASSPPSGPLGLFRQKAPKIMHDLMTEFGLSTVQAAGILGNIGVECAGFHSLQEQKPLKGGRGGWGWCQWTGTRRRAFEQWASEKNLDFKSDEANYGYLLQELQGAFASSLRRLKQARDVETATTDFMNTFEMPAERTAGLTNRINYAQRALKEYMRAYNV